jgi:hypothetical protein
MHEALSKARLEKRLGEYEERRVSQELMALMSYDKFASPRRNPEDRQQRRSERANLRRHYVPDTKPIGQNLYIAELIKNGLSNNLSAYAMTPGSSA